MACTHTKNWQPIHDPHCDCEVDETCKLINDEGVEEIYPKQKTNFHLVRCKNCTSSTRLEDCENVHDSYDCTKCVNCSGLHKCDGLVDVHRKRTPESRRAEHYFRLNMKGNK